MHAMPLSRSGCGRSTGRGLLWPWSPGSLMPRGQARVQAAFIKDEIQPMLNIEGAVATLVGARDKGLSFCVNARQPFVSKSSMEGVMRSPVGDEQRGNDISCRRPQNVENLDAAKAGCQHSNAAPPFRHYIGWMACQESHPYYSSSPRTVLIQEVSKDQSKNPETNVVHSLLIPNPKYVDWKEMLRGMSQARFRIFYLQ